MQYKVGDVVRIRDWDDLVVEFGEGDCDIPCPFTFISEMIVFCGKEYVVSKIRDSGDRYDGEPVQQLYFEDRGDDIGQYSISGQMVELVIEEEAPDDIVVPDIGNLF